ncbi:PadR family transcriptional regulator [Cryobacterium zongtaii]|uniref:PadR family transcriptional regulator n=1 Tax=Cryobacterium zongtaii TaxID=1259217 RepID=A0A2S3Z677_9MICO|nr:helix-turn-helix transcriptional regulator [Cryobacterium zongtaii]POH60052.1 PadR family transcriptional regulator [Cryobacterium zongtaii]
MDPITRVTAATVDVLRALLSSSEPLWGLAVIKQTGRLPGSVYPILERLEKLGWAESTWGIDAERSGPRRRLYQLTAPGALAATRTCYQFDARARLNVSVVTS